MARPTSPQPYAWWCWTSGKHACANDECRADSTKPASYTRLPSAAQHAMHGQTRIYHVLSNKRGVLAIITCASYRSWLGMSDLLVVFNYWSRSTTGTPNGQARKNTASSLARSTHHT